VQIKEYQKPLRKAAAFDISVRFGFISKRRHWSEQDKHRLF